MTTFQDKVKALRAHHEELLSRKNEPVEWGNGIYEKYKNPILTAEHTPLEWRYDFDEKSNPYLMQRIMMNATLNSGAIKWNGKYLLVVRVEGADRKSFFAVAESPNGVDNFRFWDEPITMPEDVVPATNIYDMRLTAHEDGYIYGVFCAERHDDAQPGDLSAATATAAIARTKDLVNWERLPDLKTKSQQRNVVLHPEFVDGKYAFYTRPQDGFIDTGSGGGIGWALVDDITHAEIKEEKIINARHYHTIQEVKNGEGPHPIKTDKGWLYCAGVQLLAPHQNHPPFISCHGRKITGTSLPSLVLRERMKSDTFLSQQSNFCCCAPPSRTAATASPFGSQAFSPVAGFQGCQLKVTIPPLLYCAMISWRILSNGTPSRCSLLSSSILPRSNPITAG